DGGLTQIRRAGEGEPVEGERQDVVDAGDVAEALDVQHGVGRDGDPRGVGTPRAAHCGGARIRLRIVDVHEHLVERAHVLARNAQAYAAAAVSAPARGGQRRDEVAVHLHVEAGWRGSRG